MFHELGGQSSFRFLTHIQEINAGVMSKCLCKKCGDTWGLHLQVSMQQMCVDAWGLGPESPSVFAKHVWTLRACISKCLSTHHTTPTTHVTIQIHCIP